MVLMHYFSPIFSVCFCHLSYILPPDDVTNGGYSNQGRKSKRTQPAVSNHSRQIDIAILFHLLSVFAPCFDDLSRIILLWYFSLN